MKTKFQYTWKNFIPVIMCLMFLYGCKSPNYKQLVGEWNIDEFHVVIKSQTGKLIIDTTMKNCGKFVFYKVDEFSKKENKGKIKGYVEKPAYVRVGNANVFLPEKMWFEGTAREPQIIGNDIEFWFWGLTPYTVTERNGKTLKAYNEQGDSYQETVVLTKK